MRLNLYRVSGESLEFVKSFTTLASVIPDIIRMLVLGYDVTIKQERK